MEKVTIVPFVKWVGGKRQLLPELIKRMPSSYNRYFEPFVGGGALLFALKPKEAIINDLNKELITTYKTIKSKAKELMEILELLEKGHSVNQDKKKFYYKLRNINLLENTKKYTKQFIAARFIYLNKAGFNGIYRVNSNGDFNVPNGNRKNLKTHSNENIIGVSNYLKENKIRIFNRSFEKACKLAKSGDFVYFDPPYDYENGINGFDSFSAKGFGKEKQKLLAKVCQELDGRGVKFMLSNHNTTLIKELYKDFKMEIIKAKRLVGGKGARRNDVEEVIVRNYG